jgi:hypothetical protein
MRQSTAYDTRVKSENAFLLAEKAFSMILRGK